MNNKIIKWLLVFATVVALGVGALLGQKYVAHAAIGGGVVQHNHSGALAGGNAINAATVSRGGLPVTTTESFYGASSTDFLVTATPPGATLNLKIGDIVQIIYNSSALRNGADFTIKMTLSCSGTGTYDSSPGNGYISGTAVDAGAQDGPQLNAENVWPRKAKANRPPAHERVHFSRDFQL